MRTQVEGLEVEVTLDPPVRSLNLDIERPSLAHPLADAENLLQAINRAGGPPARTVDLRVMQTLSPQLRAGDWRCCAHVRGAEVIAVTPPDAAPLGLAVDLGSTKIAGYLVDLHDGRTLAASGMIEPTDQLRRGHRQPHHPRREGARRQRQAADGRRRGTQPAGGRAV